MALMRTTYFKAQHLQSFDDLADEVELQIMNVCLTIRLEQLPELTTNYQSLVYRSFVTILFMLIFLCFRVVYV